MKGFRVTLASLLFSLCMFACATAPQPQLQEHVGAGHFTLNDRPTKLGTIQYTATHRSAAMTDLVTAMGATGTLMILTGAQPATNATVDSGTVLVVLPLAATPGTVSAGVLTFGSITTTAASGTGTAAHFLICTTSNTANCVAVTSATRVMQGSVGVSASDINFAGGVSFTSGTNISISTLTITANGA